MIPLAPLEELKQLKREWLHVFVAAPGQGEGIAIALPEQGWLLVDGCTAGDGRFPLEVILERWRAPADDPVQAMVLTHPHQDHVEGIAELIEALKPEWVAVTAGDSPGKTLLQVASTLTRAKPGENTQTQLLAKKVVAALAAIEGWEAAHPGRLLGLLDGQHLLKRAGVQVQARAPDQTGLESFLRSKGLARRLQSDANHVSLVLELSFGALRLVLTGDLPYLKSKGMTARGGHSRAWLVTPFNSSDLPHLTRLEGLPTLLKHEPEVLLTAIPASKYVQAAQPAGGFIQLAQLVDRQAGQKAGGSFLDGGTVISPGSAVGRWTRSGVWRSTRRGPFRAGGMEARRSP